MNTIFPKSRARISNIFFLLGMVLILYACNPNSKTEESQTASLEQKKEENPSGYDAELAKKYGADEYGMKKYVMAFLKKGPNRDLDEKKAAELQAAHMENIGKMAEAGKLILAGPFFGQGELRGIYIFDVQSLEEAKALTESDPAIQAGSLIMELEEWYGSAALMAVSELHERIARNDP